jgi:SAM-dependent methyltransferase
MTELSYNKIIDLADFSDPVLRPYIEQIAYDEMIRFGLDAPEVIPDSKQWECAMMLKSFDDHGLIAPGKLFAGIGAGTEQTTFALASKGCITFPADRYLEVTPWSDVAPAPMMLRPRQYSNFDYPVGSVIPVHSDARVMEFPSNFFDGAYSAGSIEHFGSLDAVAAAAEEMGRVLKPGGIASLSTEFRLEGPNGVGWFDDNCILFTPELIEEYIVKPSGLRLVDSLRTTTSESTFNSQVVLLDFLSKAVKVQTIEDKRNAYPNLILFHEGFLFCSVHLCLVKDDRPTTSRGAYSRKFDATVEEESIKASGVLTEQIKLWHENFANGGSAEANKTARITQLEADLEAVRSERDRLSADMHGVERAVIDGRTGDALALDWVEYADFPADKLYTIIGSLEDGVFHSRGNSGFLSFGPYTDLPIGHYRIAFDVTTDKAQPAQITVDICYGEPPAVISYVTLSSDDLPDAAAIEFTCDIPAERVEFRVSVAGETDVMMRGLKVYRRRVIRQ